MTPCPAATLPLPDADATALLGAALAPMLRAGDTVLLQGPIGAGKTHFARALIQARQAAAGRAPEEVPSPSFTLVQIYDAGDAEIWHADLYRLNTPSEADELGLTEAFAEAICLVEWPERLGSEVPPDALHLSFAYSGESRVVRAGANSARWAPVIDTLWRTTSGGFAGAAGLQ